MTDQQLFELFRSTGASQNSHKWADYEKCKTAIQNAGITGAEYNHALRLAVKWVAV